jgi:hypothetical protein
VPQMSKSMEFGGGRASVVVGKEKFIKINRRD